MDKDGWQLTREQLYELVWSKPMTKVAAEFGISDGALAKHCRKMNVPRPAPGYWARTAHGQTPKRPKLPRAKADTPADVLLPKRNRETWWRATAVAPEVRVPEKIESFHKTVREIAKALSVSRFSSQMIEVRGSERPVVRISPASTDRALRILHALFGAIESRGAFVDFSELDGEEHELHAIVGEQAAPVPLSLTERLAQKPGRAEQEGLPRNSG